MWPSLQCQTYLVQNVLHHTDHSNPVVTEQYYIQSVCSLTEQCVWPWVKMRQTIEQGWLLQKSQW